MFELNAAIRDWRLAFGDSMREEDVNELEEHLRSQVEALMGMELSEEEAFLLARRRIGSETELASEFTRVHGRVNWIGIAQWMVLAFLGMNVLVMGLNLVTVLRSARAPDLDSITVLAALILILAIGLAAVAWLFIVLVRARNHRRFVLLSLVLALTISLTGLGSLLVVLMGHHDFATAPDQALITYRWYLGIASLIVILSLGLSFGVYASERRRRKAKQSLIQSPP